MPATASTKSYSASKPGTVSKNLTRLRDEAEFNRTQLGKESNFPASTIEKMELVYEPPANHPYLPRIAKALAKKLGRSAETVLAELVKGGANTEFTNSQLARIFQNHRSLAPQGFFTNKPAKAPKKTAKKVVKVKAVKPDKKKTPRNSKFKSLVAFLDTDARIKKLAKQMEMPLPRDKHGPTGKVLGQSIFAVRQRALKLMDRLKEAGVDIKATMEREDATAPAAPQRRGHRGLGDLRKIVYTSVTTYNHRRTTGERQMTMPMDDFEIMLADYLKLSGIDPRVLISRDISKLIPKG